MKIAAAGAMSQDAMAKNLGINRRTLAKAFREELDSALADLTVRVHANFLRIATGDSKSAAWAAERWLRMRAPQQWRDQPTEITGADGGPLVVTSYVVRAPKPTESAAEWLQTYTPKPEKS